MSAGMSVRAVVFDLDGTLLDSMPVVLACYRRTILELGGPACSSDEILGAFSIGPAAEMLASLIGRPVGEEAVKRYQALLAAEASRVIPYPGIADLLRSLPDTLPLGVFSAADTAAATLLLDATELLKFFGAVVGAESVPRSKPAPDGLVLTCELLGVAPGETAYIGDGPADIEVARRCGALALAASWGHQFHEEHEADAILTRPLDLLRYLRGVPRTRARFP